MTSGSSGKTSFGGGWVVLSGEIEVWLNIEAILREDPERTGAIRDHEDGAAR